jgi:hypothetical protein
MDRRDARRLALSRLPRAGGRMNDALDKAIAGAVQPAERLQITVQLAPGASGEQRLVALDLPKPLTPHDVFLLVGTLYDVLRRPENQAGPRSRIVLPQ